MKKRFSLIFTSVTALILAVIMISGCSFIKKSGGKVFVSDDDAASVAAAEYVGFNTTEKERNLEDTLIESVEKVKRSAVQIITGTGMAGSGVIIDISCESTDEYSASWKSDPNIVYIITCHHMVAKDGSYGTEGIGEIEITIPDEKYSYDNPDFIFYGYIGNDTAAEYKSRNYAITLVGGDFESDIALLKLDLGVSAKSGKYLSADKIVKAQIPYETAANPYNERLGETVFSVGNPSGLLPGSVAKGIISYLNRDDRVSVSSSYNIVLDMTLLQIDVATNSGSSGGGLFNAYGELIGITNAGASKELYEGINFAIPRHLENGNGFVDIASQLLGTAKEDNYGYVSGRKVKFGFTVKEDGEGENVGLYVASVTSGSIAAKKGLQVYDNLIDVKVTRNGETIFSGNIKTVAKFSEVFEDLTAGDGVVMTVERTSWNAWRSTQTKTIEMVVESFLFCNTGK
ncbi:MAG: trypsin-like peptidase domain-containing protein [Clostridia bacterium]|nr:trypsin-like peptidase domain-containing protein [Clostridia bacterium]